MRVFYLDSEADTVVTFHPPDRCELLLATEDRERFKVSMSRSTAAGLQQALVREKPIPHGRNERIQARRDSGEEVEVFETPAAPVIIQGGTGAEAWLLGWKLARRDVRDELDLALGGDVLRGYVVAHIAKAKGEPTDMDAALRAWAKP